jgi:preprotein translocase subunit SecF
MNKGMLPRSVRSSPIASMSGRALMRRIAIVSPVFLLKLSIALSKSSVSLIFTHAPIIGLISVHYFSLFINNVQALILNKADHDHVLGDISRAIASQG